MTGSCRYALCFRAFLRLELHLQLVERVRQVLCLVLLMSISKSCCSNCLPSACTCADVLQGSQDAEAWSILRVHSNDHTVKLAGQYASWPVTGYAACISFRFFRLYQSSSSASCANQSSRQLALTYLELYGHFGVDSVITQGLSHHQ